MAYNAFEKLRDSSHRACLSLDAWKQILEHAGFTVERKETLDQDIEFAPWAARMRCDAPTEARLRDLLANEPLRSLLRPRDRGAVLSLRCRRRSSRRESRVTLGTACLPQCHNSVTPIDRGPDRL